MFMEDCYFAALRAIFLVFGKAKKWGAEQMFQPVDVFIAVFCVQSQNIGNQIVKRNDGCTVQ